MGDDITRSRRQQANFRAKVLGGASFIAAMGAAFPALAQESQESEGIVVTSSRIARSGFTSPTPTISFGKDELDIQAVSNPADLLSQLPNFNSGGTLRTSGVTSNGGGKITVGLSARGGSTLVLVDGRRYPSAGADGDVDLNQIPTLLTERIEVVTGGASAAWGSDAVAGVVNLHLDTNLRGIVGSFQGSESQLKDGKQGQGSLAAGFSFGGGRGSFVVGGDYVNGGKVGNQYTRDWGRQEWGKITNPNYATNGLPNFILSPNVRNAVNYSGGVITSGPLKGIAFGPDGTPFNFAYGQVFGNSMIGGTGYGESTPVGTLLATPIERGNILAHATFDLTNRIQVFGEAAWAETVVTGQTGQPRDPSLSIRRDNAFLPESVRQAMINNNLTTISVGRQSIDFGFNPIENTTNTRRFAAGLKGDLDGVVPFGANWGWDAYAQIGRGGYQDVLGVTRNNPNFNLSIDAVVNPATGSIVCRSTLTNPTNGCIPTNIFGNGNAVPNSYTSGVYWTTVDTEQDIYAANLRGDPFSTWAGPVSVAFGVEHRKESAVVKSEAHSLTQNANGTVGEWNQGNAQPYSGEYDVTEVYAETVVPLASELPLADLLELNAAIRRSEYSTSGETISWKVGLNYSPAPDLRFRVTRSRDMRAPNIQELFSPTSQAGRSTIVNSLGISDDTLRYTSGNSSLTPEIAATWTAGVAYQPSWIPGLSLSADYYNVEINNAISSLGQEQIARFCFGGDTSYCQFVNQLPNGDLISITSPFLNLNSTEAAGVDLEASYRFPLEKIFASLPGELMIRYGGAYVDKNVTIAPAAAPVNSLLRAWRWNTSVTYETERLSLNLQARYIGEGNYDNAMTEGAGAANTVSDNSVSPVVYFNLGAEYAIWTGEADRNVRVFGRIENLFDKDPPMLPSGSGGGIGNSSLERNGLYDAIGRYFKLGVRFKY